MAYKMLNNVLIFIAGFGLACVVYTFLPDDEITPLKDDVNLQRLDSFKTVLNARNDSFKLVIDSLNLQPIKTEKEFIIINEKIKNHYANTDTFTNSDSLTNVIKRAIQLGRVKGN